MAKLSPLQRVREEHTSKTELARKVLEFLTVPEGESQEHFEDRIMHLSNAKLLRLWDNEAKMKKIFGSREHLISSLVKAKFRNGNEDYERKLSTYSTTRLLDLARQYKL